MANSKSSDGAGYLRGAGILPAVLRRVKDKKNRRRDAGATKSAAPIQHY
jgi:hypothetical protein